MPRSVWTRIAAEPEPVTLEWSRTALVAVDLQNAFLHPEGYFLRLGRAREVDLRPVVVNCRRVIACLRSRVRLVVYLRMAPGPEVDVLSGPDSVVGQKSGTLRLLREHPEMRPFLPLEGSWGAEILEELAPQAGDLVIRKSYYDGFEGTNLDSVLRAAAVKWLIFVGIASNVCVESTLRRAYHLGYRPLLVGDAVAAVGPEGVQEATLYNVKTFFGWVTDATALIEGPEGAAEPKAEE
ncbi:MAG: cysteine hydrolase family protein [Moorellales bacterium]